MNYMRLKFLFSFSLMVTAGAAQAQLINGNFATGDFTGWTLINTANGGSALTQVTLFDTAGTGVPTYSAEFEAGEVSGGEGGGGLGQGAGISQDVLLGAGQLGISLDIAATTPGNNADAGTFELFLDGIVVASHAFGGINVGQTLRSTLNYTGTITAGTHDIAIEILRGYGAEYPDTPFEYIANVELSGSAVPEPAGASLAALGLTVLAIAIRRAKAN
jgi:hypothetical protein